MCCYLLFLFSDDSIDPFCRSRQRRSGLRASLVFRVNKRNVRKSDETQNVAQVGLLKIESFPPRALCIGTPAGSDEVKFLSSEEALRTVWPIAQGLPDPNNLVNP